MDDPWTAPSPSPSPSSFCPQGGVAVLAHQLETVCHIMMAARDVLNAESVLRARSPANSADCDRQSGQSRQSRQRVCVVNGQLTFATAGMQAVTDALASFCQASLPDDHVAGPCHFSRYPFDVSDYNFISKARDKIYQPLFQGMNLDELASRCKHQLPWLGTPSPNADDLDDIHDARGVGLLRQVLVPAYYHIKRVIERLGDMHSVVVLPNV